MHTIVWLVFFFSGSGAWRLTKLTLNSQPSPRVLATLLKTTCANRLLSDEAESEVHEGNALCHLPRSVCLGADMWIHSVKMLLHSDTKQGCFLKYCSSFPPPLYLQINIQVDISLKTKFRNSLGSSSA